MEICERRFDLEGMKDYINIYFVGDVHEGNVNHAADEFRRAVAIIKDDPHGYWIGMGDFVDAVVYTDKKRFNPVTIDPEYRVKDLKDLPRKQINNFFEKVKPIKDKCLALLIGNHEETIIKHYHNDIYDMLLRRFKMQPEKMGYVGFFRLKLYTQGQRRFSVLLALNHGDGGGGFREGYPINKLHDVFRAYDADICVMGHVHQLVEDDRKVMTVDQNGNLKKRFRYWGISGSFLKTYNDGTANYFEHKGRWESHIGMLKATIAFSRTQPDYYSKQIQLNKIKLG